MPVVWTEFEVMDIISFQNAPVFKQGLLYRSAPGFVGAYV